MAVRRTGITTKRILDRRFPMPPGTNIFEHEEAEPDDEGDYEEDEEEKEKKKKKKKRKKKKKKRKKKNGKGKKKGKNKKKKNNRDDDKKVNSPKSLTVVKQTIRTKKDGSQVVDLTVDVDRINRADKYEFRVVKKDNGNVQVITG